MLAKKVGKPSNHVYYNLQEERRLTTEALARPGSVTDALRRQRQLTDEAVREFRRVSDETADTAPAEIRTAAAEARQAMDKLADQRAAVDRAAVDQQAVYTYFTDLIAVDLRLFTELSRIDNGEVTWTSRALVSSLWAKEMLSREDALLARGWPSGKLAIADYQQVQQAISTQDYLFNLQIVPFVPAQEVSAWHEVMNSPVWRNKIAVEQALLRPVSADAGGSVKLPTTQDQWRQAVDQINPQLVIVIDTRTDDVVEVSRSSFLALLSRFVQTTIAGLIAVIVVVVTSWRLTRSMRRRIKDLQGQAQELELTLPEVVERLSRGEQVDVEAETRAITAGEHGKGNDELARLGQALNLARTSALATSVRQAEQHRGFERLLQRIARRTQLLIGQQLRKLDELERKHDDPEVLEGLFDLDHLTSRLRRYEENLVIMAGGQPQRKWRKPVPLLDVLRAAQGEVQDYRRIMVDVEGHPWISERAVGPVAHVIAELMENAATFSKPPTPVEVRAAMVGRGLAVEIEDRGLGMDPEQYDAANELMSRPPRMDVLARANDIRLGFYVVARLAANTGLKIEFRPSAFGGTRVVVLVPAELVIDGDAGLPDATPVEPIPLARRTRKAALAALTPAADVPAAGGAAGTAAGVLADAAGAGAGSAHGPLSATDDGQLSGAAVEPPETVLGPSAAAGAPVEAFAHVEYIQPLTSEPVEHQSPADDQGTGPHGGYDRVDGFGGGRFGGDGFAGDGYDGDGYDSLFDAKRAPVPAQAGHDAPSDGHAGYVGTAGQSVEPGPVVESDRSGSSGYDGAEHAEPVHSSPEQGTPVHGAPVSPVSPAYDAPAYPDIAYAKVTAAEAPYADEQYRPAEHYRLAERREYAPSVPYSAPADGQPPLPQRIRQASLAAELRVPPPARSDTAAAGHGGVHGALPGSAGPFGDATSPFERPRPTRSGAAIGAFQRQSRAARVQEPGEAHLPAAAGPGRRSLPAPFDPPTAAPGPSPWALPAADPRTTRTDDQS
ncbi:ATP-binding protein [Kitasatospora sp. A2-31]|uniref:ATP-binding protein n=1 Tax=Kitasatospora sp. A2-31 TaxID=2916414 RepID=UPI001EECEF43|nr:ATP-binding protein [Kitasatospora sp. A2-31]MCG6495806.1 nitrate- and nitrite sensing domain-containing protein [Kitasatospora sp. A2-31]